MGEQLIERDQHEVRVVTTLQMPPAWVMKLVRRWRRRGAHEYADELLGAFAEQP